MVWGIIILVIILLACAFLFFITPAKASEALRPGFYAHRGLHTRDKSVPENSMAAFAKAADCGYGIELDVQLTKDGQVVVFHDFNLLRVCREARMLKDCTYEQLQGYPLENTAQTIPLFSEVLKLIGGRVPLIIELKNESFSNELEKKTAELLKNYQGGFCIESFNPFSVRWFKRHVPRIVRGQLLTSFDKEGGVRSKLRRVILQNLLLNFLAKPQFIACNYLYYKNFPVRWCRFRGCALAAWTIRDEETIEQLQKDFDIIIFEHFLPKVKEDKCQINKA